MAVVSAAVGAADASVLVARALRARPLPESARTIHLLALGKAAVPMAGTFDRHFARGVARGLVIGLPPRGAFTSQYVHLEGAHPVPDERSVTAGSSALEMAARTDRDWLVVLLSGGASSMAAVPARGVPLEAKRQTTHRLLRHDADIDRINCVRKHLSAIKGGRLAAASSTPVLTLVISDVVGNDLSVIGSGPTVPDPTTYDAALSVLDGCGGRAGFPAAVIKHLERGARGEVPETPKPGDTAFARAETAVIGSAADALDGARLAAQDLGFRVIVREHPVVGEARVRASQDLNELRAIVEAHPGTVCVLSAGETTVRVIGAGRGGRNQEYALSASLGLASFGRPVVLASVGTDGVDGPTDAAGAVADSTTVVRAYQHGLDPMRYLDANDAWSFFDSLGDLVRTGVTNTNVGDIQVTLIGESQ